MAPKYKSIHDAPAGASVSVGRQYLEVGDVVASNGLGIFSASGQDIQIVVPSGATARNAQALSAADYWLAWPVLDAAGNQMTVADKPALNLEWEWITQNSTDGIVLCPGIAAAVNLGALALTANSRWLNLYNSGANSASTNGKRNTDTVQTGTLRAAPGPAFLDPHIGPSGWRAAMYGQNYGATGEANVHSPADALTSAHLLFAFLAVMPWVSPSADRTIVGSLYLRRR
jgi:hypothetical protein